MLVQTATKLLMSRVLSKRSIIFFRIILSLSFLQTNIILKLWQIVVFKNLDNFICLYISEISAYERAPIGELQLSLYRKGVYVGPRPAFRTGNSSPKDRLNMYELQNERNKEGKETMMLLKPPRSPSSCIRVYACLKIYL